MSEPGKAMMGTASAGGPDRATKAADAAVACPLLDGIGLSGARGVLVLIAASKGTFKLAESRNAMNTIRRHATDDAHVDDRRLMRPISSVMTLKPAGEAAVAKFFVAVALLAPPLLIVVAIVRMRTPADSHEFQGAQRHMHKQAQSERHRTAGSARAARSTWPAGGHRRPGAPAAAPTRTNTHQQSLDNLWRFRHIAVMPESALKPVDWIGSSYKDFRAFPDEVQDHMGYALHLAQTGRSTMTRSR